MTLTDAALSPPTRRPEFQRSIDVQWSLLSLPNESLSSRPSVDALDSVSPLRPAGGRACKSQSNKFPSKVPLNARMRGQSTSMQVTGEGSGSANSSARSREPARDVGHAGDLALSDEVPRLLTAMSTSSGLTLSNPRLGKQTGNARFNLFAACGGLSTASSLSSSSGGVIGASCKWAGTTGDPGGSGGAGAGVGAANGGGVSCRKGKSAKGNASVGITFSWLPGRAAVTPSKRTS